MSMQDDRADDHEGAKIKTEKLEVLNAAVRRNLRGETEQRREPSSATGSNAGSRELDEDDEDE
jgi:hypothetical protein